jgi:hypothetical protein
MLIIQILIRHEKIPSACPESIRLWTPWSAATFKVSLIVTQAIIRFPLKKKTKLRHLPSLYLVLFVTQ